MVTVYTEVEVDVELDEFSDDDILDEYDRRGLKSTDTDEFKESLSAIYEAYRNNRTDVVDQFLRDLFYEKLGRIA